MKKVSVGIIGTGNIGSDILTKIQRSKYLQCTIFTGQNPQSDGIKRAKKMGINTSASSIAAIEENPRICDIVFDATSAEAHMYHAPILKKIGKFAIDLTPSKIGKMCIPLLNLKECLKEDNVNMVSCGGQSVAPLAAVIKEIHPETTYLELVSSLASKSAGLATRLNIDQYTLTTRDALRFFSGVQQAKSILILNPAEPPIIMHNTLFAEVTEPKLTLLKKKIYHMVKKIQQYVPGYKLVLGPVIENNRLTIMTKVLGSGDYLPIYAGNLDIINCAAVAVAEAYAQKLLTETHEKKNSHY